MTGIQYPEAWSKPYRRVHIGDAQREESYYCFGCNSSMVVKKGAIKTHHYAHKADLVTCDPDTALHEASKMNIAEGFVGAVEVGGRYFLCFPCSRCRAVISVNVALPDAGVASERSIVTGTRSDLVFTWPDGHDRIIVEIEVTHGLEDSTRQRYEESKLPVMTLKVSSWASLPSLRKEVIASSTLNIKDTFCKDCKQREQEYYNRLERYKKMLVKMTPGHYQSPTQLQPIFRDKYSSAFYPRVEKKIRHYARRLVDLGFVQQPSRPTLFAYKVGGWSIYADLDSTEVLRIWEVDCVPAIYGFPLDRSCRECLLTAVGTLLEQSDIPYRRHFEDTTGHIDCCGDLLEAENTRTGDAYK